MSDTGIDITRYSYRVAWPVDDSEYIATCPEFHSLSYSGKSYSGKFNPRRRTAPPTAGDAGCRGAPQPKSVPRPTAHQRILTVGKERSRQPETYTAFGGVRRPRGPTIRKQRLCAPCPWLGDVITIGQRLAVAEAFKLAVHDGPPFTAPVTGEDERTFLLKRM